jgi:ribosomal-protein-alanine N-acetyltransferase
MTIDIARLDAQSDVTDVAALQAETFTNPWSADSIRWELAHTDVARVYVLRVDGVLAAFCACWVILDELHINSLAVAPARRRQGLATALLRAVFREVGPEGVTKATLEVRRSNAAALGLYAALGFAVEGVRKDYYQQPREDALVLWCRDLAASVAAI